MYGRVLLLFLLGTAPLTPVRGDAADPAFDRQQALATSQAAIGRTVDGVVLQGTRGPVPLADLRGKPLVLSLVYSSCFHTCPVTTSYLHEVVRIAREALGEGSFNVATVGFDVPTDSPARMAGFARQHRIDEPGWFFLGGDTPAIDALTRAVGFQYFASPRGFDHLVQATVLDAEGRVYRQVYGESFEAPALVEPLKELLIGARTQPDALAEWVNDVRLFCTVYDPSTGRYAFDYSVLVAAIVGVLCLGGLAAWLVQAWREATQSAAARRPARRSTPPVGTGGRLP